MEKIDGLVRLNKGWIALSAIGIIIGASAIYYLNRFSDSAVAQSAERKLNSSNSQAAISNNNITISNTIDRWRSQTRSLILSLSIPNLYQGKVFEKVKIKGNSKVIALTFDDGPSLGGTDRILEILRRNNVKATFFIIGRNLQLYPQIGQQIVSEGHAIANHTWSHSYKHFNWASAAREVDNTTNLIYKLTGVKTSLFRPPGGFLNNGPAGYAKSKKYGVALWSADSNDWKHPSVAALVNSVLKEATSGGIALMHDGGGDRSHTIKALPIIISKLKSKGYSFVTLPELLEMGDRPAEEQMANSVTVKSAN